MVEVFLLEDDRAPLRLRVAADSLDKPAAKLLKAYAKARGPQRVALVGTHVVVAEGSAATVRDAAAAGRLRVVAASPHRLSYANLDRRADRDATFRAAAAKAGFFGSSLKRFAAVDGEALDLATVPRDVITAEGLAAAADESEYVCPRGSSEDGPRGDAAAATWIVRGDESRRRRFLSAETSRGAAAAATWIVRADESPQRSTIIRLRLRRRRPYVGKPGASAAAGSARSRSRTPGNAAAPSATAPSQTATPATQTL